MKNLKCGLIGERLGHSYSKQIHASIAPYEYELYAVSREQAKAMIKSDEFSGLNVTIPYKELAYSLCDELDDFAREAKSVNTITHRNGKTLGANTDIFGFIEMVKHAGIDFSGRRILVLGSGGTSKTACVASKMLGAESITVVSRKGEINYENVYSLSDAEIIVNTTPVGMFPNVGNSPVELSRFENCKGVVDVVYNPAKTKLLFDAESLNIPCTNGLYMLAAQAVRAAEIFTGESFGRESIDRAAGSVSCAMKNIVLIGMPGSGKSTIAKKLAYLTHREVIDTDEVISSRTGTPASIINSRGEEAFRNIEAEVIAEFGAKSSLIISTGGGAVLRPENLPSLSQNGKIYLINRDLSKLATNGRPLSEDVFSLFEQRKDKYSLFADASVHNSGDALSCAEEILRDFKKL